MNPNIKKKKNSLPFQNCKACKINFSRTGLKIHHCRNCGEGFCYSCSRSRLPVPSRGWNEPVRVCNDCRDELKKNSENGDTVGKRIEHEGKTFSTNRKRRFESPFNSKKYFQIIELTIPKRQTFVFENVAK